MANFHIVKYDRSVKQREEEILELWKTNREWDPSSPLWIIIHVGCLIFGCVFGFAVLSVMAKANIDTSTKWGAVCGFFVLGLSIAFKAMLPTKQQVADLMSVQECVMRESLHLECKMDPERRLYRLYEEPIVLTDFTSGSRASAIILYDMIEAYHEEEDYCAGYPFRNIFLFIACLVIRAFLGKEMAFILFVVGACMLLCSVLRSVIRLSKIDEDINYIGDDLSKDLEVSLRGKVAPRSGLGEPRILTWSFTGQEFLVTFGYELDF